MLSLTATSRGPLVDGTARQYLAPQQATSWHGTQKMQLIAMKISHRVYVMGHGQIVFEGSPAELEKRDDIRKEWLEV